MKKTLVLITLALVMVASIFASERTPYANLPEEGETTKVFIDLDKNPSYVLAVTQKADRAKKDSTTLTHVDEIELSWDKDDENRPITYTTDGTYYVSYRFLETEAVKVKMQLSGDMILKGKTNADAEDTERIPYSVTIAKDDAAITDSANAEPETVTITSKDTEKHDIITVAETEYIGDVTFDNFKFNIASYTDGNGVSHNNLAGKKVGYYSSTVTLTVEANS